MGKLQFFRIQHGMSEASLGQPVIACPIVSTDCTTRLNDSLYEGREVAARCVFQMCKTNSPNSFFPFILDGDADQSLAGRAAPAFAGLTATTLAPSIMKAALRYPSVVCSKKKRMTASLSQSSSQKSLGIQELCRFTLPTASSSHGLCSRQDESRQGSVLPGSRFSRTRCE